MVKWIVVMKIQPSICLDDWGKPQKIPSQVGTGIRIRDLPNASLVRYHGATSLGKKISVRLLGTGIRIRDLPNASLVRYHGATSLSEILAL